MKTLVFVRPRESYELTLSAPRCHFVWRVGGQVQQVGRPKTVRISRIFAFLDDLGFIRHTETDVLMRAQRRVEARRKFIADHQDEPDHDDSVKCCPDCERPNQFGEVCESCRRDRELDEAERPSV